MSDTKTLLLQKRMNLRPSRRWWDRRYFWMGSDRHYPEEAPQHEVRVDGFGSTASISNRDFEQFVENTGYVTFAEIPPDPENYPGALPEMLQAGSTVFSRQQEET